MKKRNLILSVICSAALVVLLAVFSIVDVIGIKNYKNPNNPSNSGSNVSNPSNPEKPDFDPTLNQGEDKGSKENPYYIYDVETYNTYLAALGDKLRDIKIVKQIVSLIDAVDEEGNPILNENGEPVKTIEKDEEGNIVYVDQLDENGNPVYEVVGQEPYNFKFLSDVDFAGVDYIPLFNKGTSFIGTIDGDGHTVKNITINVTTDNLAEFAYVNGKDATFHIGVFGNVSNAKIANISYDGIEIFVDHKVYTELRYGNLNAADKLNAFPREVTIGALAATVSNSEISANVSAMIDADAYSIYAESRAQGANTLGGVLGAMVNTTYSDSKVNVDIIADSDNRNYYLGGVTGYMKDSTISKVDANVSVKAVSAPNKVAVSNRLYIAGVAGFATSANITEVTVNFKVSQTETERFSISAVKQIDNEKFNVIAGIVATVRADNAENKTNISKVIVHANVDMDGLYAGAIYTVSNNEYDTAGTIHEGEYYITIEDTILDSEVNTLKAYGVASQLLYTEIKFSEDFTYAWMNVNGENIAYAVKLTGNVRLISNRDVDSLMYVAAIVSGNENNLTTGWNHSLKFDYKELKVIMSQSIANQIILTQKVELNGGVIVK